MGSVCRKVSAGYSEAWARERRGQTFFGSSWGTCEQCGEAFEENRAGQRFCSQRCRHAAWRARQPKPPVVLRTCAGCSCPFKPNAPQQKFCTKECNVEATREERLAYGRAYSRANRKPRRSTRLCVECGAEFLGASNHVTCSPECRETYSAKRHRESSRERARAKAKPRFCSGCGERFFKGSFAAGYCSACWAKEQEALAELKRVAKLVRVTRWKPCQQCGCVFAPTDKLTVFCSRACWGLSRRVPPRVCTECGEEWRPTEKPESKAATRCWECRRPKGDSAAYENVKASLRKRLILREGGKCQDCGKTEADVGEPLHAHHEQPQALGGANTLDNLRLLCPDCHLGSGWWRNHYMLALSGLVVPPIHAVAA